MRRILLVLIGLKEPLARLLLEQFDAFGWVRLIPHLPVDGLVKEARSSRIAIFASLPLSRPSFACSACTSRLSILESLRLDYTER